MFVYNFIVFSRQCKFDKIFAVLFIRNGKCCPQFVSYHICEIIIINSVDFSGLQPIIIKCYDVLVAYLDGDSRKNELYMARHFRFFEKQITFEVKLFLIIYLLQKYVYCTFVLNIYFIV